MGGRIPYFPVCKNVAYNKLCFNISDADHILPQLYVGSVQFLADRTATQYDRLLA